MLQAKFFAALLTVLMLLGIAPVQSLPAETAAPQVPTEPASQTVTIEEAREIALAHAGLTADQVRGLKAEKDKEDGRLVYEVEFKQGRVEYEYEIHAETGAVLKWEKDLD